MNLLELQDVLGDMVSQVKNSNGDKEVSTKAESIARLAKQMINNADIILRTDKLRETQGVKTSAISKVVGYDDK